MRGWLLAAAGGLYAAALLATAPATLLDAGLREASEGRVRLAEARGTLWSGAGRLEIRDAGARAAVAKRVAWRLEPGSLLRARLSYAITLEAPARAFPASLSWSGVELANAELTLPASALGLGVESLAPLGLSGDVLVRVAALSVSRDALRGSAVLHWRAAGSALTPVSPLGDYEVRLDGAGATVRGLLRTVEGPLQLDGRGSWTPGSRIEFSGTARVPPQHEPQLSPLLRLIAVERSSGSFELRLN